MRIGAGVNRKKDENFKIDSVAQLVEQQTLNLRVQSSSLCGVTNYFLRMNQQASDSNRGGLPPKQCNALLFHYQLFVFPHLLITTDSWGRYGFGIFARRVSEGITIYR